VDVIPKVNLKELFYCERHGLIEPGRFDRDWSDERGCPVPTYREEPCDEPVVAVLGMEQIFRDGIAARDGAVLTADDARLLMSDRGRLDSTDAKKRDDLIYRLVALKEKA
jgi:hypothetical protein